MEIFRRLGVADKLRGIGLPADYPNDIVSATSVTGIELSRPMIEQLRTKADEAAIPVIAGDMATTRAPGTYTLVYLVYNTISNLLTQSEQVACFRNAARHLTPGGRFVIAGDLDGVRGARSIPGPVDLAVLGESVTRVRAVAPGAAWLTGHPVGDRPARAP
jgi:SAM-dependent methyltransferase